MAYLEMKQITKHFGSLVANENVNLTVEKGEIHALLGENGAGKSTLMNILYGMYSQTDGEIFLNGKKIMIKDSKHAIDEGIGMVHQHFMLIPSLSVIENVVLGFQKYSKISLNLAETSKHFTNMAAKFGMEISPWEIVENLSIGEQQRLEILKALFRNVELLILDEPTAILTPQETNKLFKLLKDLSNNSMLTIIFITHKLAEVMEICDSCTVLRQGKVVASLKVDEIKSKEQLASLMVGKEVDLEIHKEPARPKDTILSVNNISYTDKNNIMRLIDVSFFVRRGEILGICGVDGNGQSELIKCITGLLSAQTGQVIINGSDVTNSKPKDILKHKIGHIPEDRHKMGMIKEMTVNENLILMSYDSKENCKYGFLKLKEISIHNEELCKKYEVKTPSIYEIASKSLSLIKTVQVVRKNDKIEIKNHWGMCDETRKIMGNNRRILGRSKAFNSK